MFARARLFLPAALLSVALLASFTFAGFAFAASKGQDDLDKATEAKLSVATLGDLGEVIRLTESALKKGLDATNTEFATKLLAATYLQRAQEISKQMFDETTTAEDFRQRRRLVVADLEKTLKLDEKQPQAHLLLAQLNMLPGGAGVKSVRQSLDKAIEFGDEDTTSKSKALALRAGLQEQEDKKLADFDEAVRLAPDDVTLLRARGLTLADLDRNEAALADFNKAIELEPTHAPTLEAKAIVLAQLKRYDEAVAALNKVKELSPKSLSPLLHLAKVHAMQQKFDAAVEDLNQALAMDSGNIAVLLLRAGVFEEKGDKKKAMDDVDAAAKLRPDMPLVIRTRAMLLAENEQFDEAVVELEKLVKLDPRDSVTQLQLAGIYEMKKQSAKAIKIYTAVLAATPDDWQAWRGRADAYLNIGKHAEAIADYEKALKLQPKDDGILNNFAWVLATSPDAKLRDGRRAIKLAKEACELTENKMPHILSTLAAAYAETGDFKNAMKWSTKAVELGGKDKETGEALKKELESYKAKKPVRESLTEDAAPAPPKPKK
jgi:tetratricopeptide (TPR) repeat protein